MTWHLKKNQKWTLLCNQKSIITTVNFFLTNNWQWFSKICLRLYSKFNFIKNTIHKIIGFFVRNCTFLYLLNIIIFKSAFITLNTLILKKNEYKYKIVDFYKKVPRQNKFGNDLFRLTLNALLLYTYLSIISCI